MGVSFIKLKLTLTIFILTIVIAITSFGLKTVKTIKQNKLQTDKSLKIDENFSQCVIKDKEAKGNANDLYFANTAQLMSIFRAGDAGDKIVYIQQRLRVFNYPITVDGEFGNETLWAVKDFQRRNGLQADGIVGPLTLSKLNQEPTEKTKYKAIDYSNLGGSKESKEAFVNTNLTSTTNSLITVSLKTKEINIFSYSNNRWNLTKVFMCSVGAKDTPTVTGDFKVGYKGYSFGQEKGYVCKYYTQFYGNYLFHSILYDLNGNILDGRLGEEISHGCIRLEVENAKYIYDNIPEGTTVIVR